MDKPFYWGVATAATQIEGGWLDDGKGPSIWDAFSQIPGKISDGSTTCVTCDHYHHMEKDVDLLAGLGVNAYRFSLSWPRIIPDGKGKVNTGGIAFYNRMIDKLLEKGITPFLTLYHWDLPLALQLEDDGWLSDRTIEAFVNYAKVCYNAFGDRVKHWTTFNENWCTAVLGHGIGILAPGRVSTDQPYQVAHRLLLAHARAVRLFREGGYDGMIGMVNNCDWREPLTDSQDDKDAAQESLEFFYGWLTDPLVFGDYPALMRERLGDRLPQFTEDEQAMLKGSYDFLGLNHYTTHYASREPVQGKGSAVQNGNGGMSDDQQVHLSCDPEWPVTSFGWYVVPWGFRKMLNWIHKRYNGAPIIVTENGCTVASDKKEEAVADRFRCDFIRDYTDALIKARDEDGVNVQGYFAWTLIDDYEWCWGFTARFGLVYCDHETLERCPKESYYAYSDIIQRHLAADGGRT